MFIEHSLLDPKGPRCVSRVPCSQEPPRPPFTWLDSGLPAEPSLEFGVLRPQLPQGGPCEGPGCGSHRRWILCSHRVTTNSKSSMVVSPDWGHPGVCLPTFSLPRGQFIDHRKASVFGFCVECGAGQRLGGGGMGDLESFLEVGVGWGRGSLGPKTQTPGVRLRAADGSPPPLFPLHRGPLCSPSGRFMYLYP